MSRDPDDDALYQLIENELKREEARMSTIHQAGGQNPAVHMKLKVKGSPDKIRFFHYLMTQIDKDWPYTDDRRNPHLKVYCPECKGMIYRSPEYSPEEIKILAKQIDDSKDLKGGLTVRVKMFTRLPNCKDISNVVELEDSRESISQKVN